MTDRERVVQMTTECRAQGHASVSPYHPCVPCIVRLIAEIREECHATA